MEMAASSTNDWWPNSTGAASSTSDWFEPPTLFNTQNNDHMLGGLSSALELVPGPNYDNIFSSGGNNRDHSQNASIFSPCIGDPPNMPSSTSYNSIYGQNTHAPDLSAIVIANSFANLPDMTYDTTSNMSLSPFTNTFKHPSTSPLNKNGPRNSGLLPRNNLKARSYRAPKLAETSGIKKTKKKQDGGGMSRLLKALNLLEQLKDVLKADGSCAMPISQLEELIGQTMIRETRASRASLTSYNSDWDIASEIHSAPSSSTCEDSTSNSNFSSYSQNDSSMTFLSSEQSSDDLDPIDMRMDMETPRAQPSTSIVYYCTFSLNGERCKFSAKSQVDWIKHEESEKHYPQKRYMCIMCIDLIDDKEGNSLCAFCFAQLPAMGNNKMHYLQCREAQKGRHVFAAARKDHFRNHLKKHGMLDITDESSTWIFDVESNWLRECGFCGATFETWEERKRHVANHFQQGMDISSWKLPIRKRKRLGDPRPGINYRRDDDDNDDDDENDQNHRPNNLHAPSNWISSPSSNTQLGSSSYTMGDWAGFVGEGIFDAERPETSSREKVEAYLSHLRQMEGDTNDTSVILRYPAEKVHRLAITFSNGVILSPFGEVTFDFKASSQAAELPMVGMGTPLLKDVLSLRRLRGIRKSHFATAFAFQSEQMFDSTGSRDLTKQPREHLQPLPLIRDECKEEYYISGKDLWAKHDNECHGLLRGWVCGIDDCEHICYGNIGLLDHLFREHRLRELMQKVVVNVRESPSLSDRFPFDSDPNSAMAFGQLDLLKQYLIGRYHYAMEKSALRVQSSLTNDHHHSFPLHSPERLLDFLVSRVGPLNCENIPQPIRDLFKDPAFIDNMNFLNARSQNWVPLTISPIRQQEVKNDRILSINEENKRTDAITALNQETKPRLGKDEVKILEMEFKKNPKPTMKTKCQFAEDMGVDLARINNWFQNRRAKRKQEKNQDYQAGQAQDVFGYSERSSLDFYKGNGYFSDVPIQQSQAPEALPLMNNGPPPAVAPYNPQYTNPSSVSVESLQQILAAAQAASEHDQYPTLKKVVETLRRHLPSLANDSGDSALKDPTTPSKGSSNCNDAVDRVKLRHLDNEHQAPTPGFAGLRVKSGQTNFSGHDHSNFYASPVLGSNSTMLSHDNSTSLNTCVVGLSLSRAYDIFATELENISIETYHGLVQSSPYPSPITPPDREPRSRQPSWGTPKPPRRSSTSTITAMKPPKRIKTEASSELPSRLCSTQFTTRPTMASFGLSNENYWSVEKQYRNRLNGHFVSLLQMLPREENGLANEKKVSKVEVLDLAKKHIEELERKKRELEEDNVGLEETVTELKKRWVNLGSFRA